MNICAVAKTDTGRAVSDAFADARDRLPGVGKVAEVRRQAFAAYERLGLPHRRIEEWKYTDLRALMGEVKPLAPQPDAAALSARAWRCKRTRSRVRSKLVLVDGVFVAELSDAAGAGRQHSDAARGAGE